MLTTGAMYVAEARRILNDTFSGGYRYSDADLLAGLGHALDEAYRLRPDLFFGFTAPETVSAGTDLSAIDRRYRRAFLDYVVGYAEMVDIEAADSSRSIAYQTMFNSKLIGNVA